MGSIFSSKRHNDIASSNEHEYSNITAYFSDLCNTFKLSNDENKKKEIAAQILFSTYILNDKEKEYIPVELLMCGGEADVNGEITDSDFLRLTGKLLQKMMNSKDPKDQKSILDEIRQKTINSKINQQQKDKMLLIEDKMDEFIKEGKDIREPVINFIRQNFRGRKAEDMENKKYAAPSSLARPTYSDTDIRKSTQNNKSIDYHSENDLIQDTPSFQFSEHQLSPSETQASTIREDASLPHETENTFDEYSQYADKKQQRAQARNDSEVGTSEEIPRILQRGTSEERRRIQDCDPCNIYKSNQYMQYPVNTWPMHINNTPQAYLMPQSQYPPLEIYSLMNDMKSSINDVKSTILTSSTRPKQYDEMTIMSHYLKDIKDHLAVISNNTSSLRKIEDQLTTISNNSTNSKKIDDQLTNMGSNLLYLKKMDEQLNNISNNIMCMRMMSSQKRS